MLGRLSSFVPVYDEIVHMYEDNSGGLAEHIRRSIEGVYLDLPELIHAILRVFYDVDGSKQDQKFCLCIALSTTLLWSLRELCGCSQPWYGSHSTSVLVTS